MEREKRIDQLLEMLHREPNDVFLTYAVGLEYAADLEKNKEAENYFRRVLKLDENYVSAYYQLGKLYESVQEIPAAISTYKLGLEKARLLKNNKAVNELNEAIFLLED